MIKNIALSISSVSTIIHEPENTMGQWGHGQIACSSEQRNIADIAGLNIHEYPISGCCSRNLWSFQDAFPVWPSRLSGPLRIQKNTKHQKRKGHDCKKTCVRVHVIETARCHTAIAAIHLVDESA